MNISIVRELPEAKWDNFVNNQSTGNIFHTPEMYQVFSRTKFHRPEVWAAVQGDHMLALLLPVKISLLSKLIRRLTTRSVVYGSILCEPGSDGQNALDELLQAYTDNSEKDSLFTELRNLSDLALFQSSLHEHGFIFEHHLNYLIRLDRTEGSLLKSIGSRTRKNIRHALNQGKIRVEEVKEKKQVSICYRLLSQTYKAAQVPIADISLFENAFDILSPKGMIRFTLASVSNTPSAVSVDLLFKDVIYGWYGGVDRTCKKYPVHEILMWDILKWGTQNGYRLYDFGGAGKPDEKYGVRDFKAKFGGELIDYGRNIRIHSRSRLWLSRKGYHLLRRWL